MTSANIAALAASTKPRLIFNETTGVYNAIEPGLTGASATEVGVSSLNAEGRLVPFIIFAGESNSVGVASNTSATSPELDVRPAVNILNAATGVLAFQPLQIGSNNSNRWYDTQFNTWGGSTTLHGWENELAHSVELGEWQDSQIYMMKTGQGGSNIAQWGVGHSYGFWTEFVNRWTAAKNAFAALDLQPLPVIWYSQGINDLGLSTAVATWKAATIAHFAKMRALVGFAPIIMTKFDHDVYPGHAAEVAAYNFAMDEISDAVPLVMVFSAFDATKGDAAHWDYAGMKTVARKFINITLNQIGERYRYLTNVLKYAASTEDPAFPIPPARTELILNGSFEDGLFGISPPWNQTPPNWTISATGGSLNFAYVASAADGVSTPDGLPGKVFIFNGGNSAANGQLSQDITTTVGIAYRLEYMVKIGDANQVLNVQVLNSSSTEIAARVENSSTGTAWKIGFINFTATSTTTKIKFTDASIGGGTGADTYLDKVTCFAR